MASNVKAGGAYVELSLNSERFVKGLTQAERRLKNIGSSLTSIGTKFAAFGTAGVAGFIPAIRAASDAQEQMSKFDTVFGDQTDAMKEFADVTADELGRSSASIRQFLAQSQDLFVPLGFDQDQATELSKTLTRLAVDLASFNNVADEDALRDLNGALTGSSELMKKYGVIVNEAAIKQELLNQNLDPSNATEQQKVLARLNIILAGTTAAQGDAVRTAGSFANQMKRAQGIVRDLAIEVGDALLPGLTKALNIFNGLSRSFRGFATENREVIQAVFGVTVGVTALGVAMIGVGAAISIAGAAVGLLLRPMSIITASFSALTPLVVALANPLGVLVVAITALSAAIVTKLGLASKAFDFLRDRVSQLVGDFSVAIDAIGEALASGNIEAAAKILWVSLKFQWDQGIRYLQGKWGEFTNYLSRQFTTGALTVSEIAVTIFSGISEAWINVASSISDVWARIVNGFRNSMIDVKALALKTVFAIQSRFDETIDADAIASVIDRGADTQKQEALANLETDIADIANRRDSALEQLKRDSEGFLDLIDQNRQARLQELDRREQESLEQTQKELIDARREWEQAINAAAANRNGQAEGEAENPFANILEQLANAGDGIQAARDFVSQRAVTGGQRASQIFGTTTSVDKQQLDVQRKQLEEARKTRQAIENNRLAFS